MAGATVGEPRRGETPWSIRDHRHGHDDSLGNALHSEFTQHWGKRIEVARRSNDLRDYLAWFETGLVHAQDVAVS